MRLPIVFFFLAISLFAQDSREWLNQGIQAYKSGHYQEAADAFQKAVDLNPNDVTARLYLATTWMSLYVPGAESPENLELARRADAEFNEVLRLNPNDATALASLASLKYQQAQGMPDLEQKLAKLDEAASWYERLLTVDPQNKEAYYSLGVIDWVKWYAGWMRARADLGMKPEDPGPLRDPAIRQRLREQYSAMIEHGISNLEHALQIDPAYDDAMAYMNLLIRERADLRDTPEEYRRDVQIADQWVQQALNAKRSKAGAGSGTTPQRIRVGGNVQQNNLIRKVDPVYPPLAKQARIEGVVRFTAIIGRDGRIQNLQLVSGHPLLVGAAHQAVMQWEYRPTLLNGQAVEVVTQVDVNFTLAGN